MKYLRPKTIKNLEFRFSFDIQGNDYIIKFERNLIGFFYKEKTV